MFAQHVYNPFTGTVDRMEFDGVVAYVYQVRNHPHPFTLCVLATTAAISGAMAYTAQAIGVARCACVWVLCEVGYILCCRVHHVSMLMMYRCCTGCGVGKR